MRYLRDIFSLFGTILILLFSGCNRPSDILIADEGAPIYPDYSNISIPPNIAPLNFLLRNNPSTVEVLLKGKNGSILLRSNYKVQIPEARWRLFLLAEAGNHIKVQITAKVGKQWIQYPTFTWSVTTDKVDNYLSYRLIEPGYEVGHRMQIRERHLQNYHERVIADNNLTDRSCLNCHIYGNQNPAFSLFHIRGKEGGTVLNRDGKLRKLQTQTGQMISPAIYGSLHPSGRFGVFSTNTIVPAFHSFDREWLEVYDTDSEIYLFDFDNNRVIPIPFPTLAEEKRYFRSFPIFAADGKSIYYCEAPQVALPDSIHYLKYNIQRIGFDPQRITFGQQIDTLHHAQATGLSASLPKASPDGKRLLYSVAHYGTFPIWHRETDLRMMHLETLEVDTLPAVNAPYSDSYSSWSSNSRWFVFSGKRDDGMYGKPYFCYVDSSGRAHKPFLLPQKDPEHYDYTLKSFNIPELATGPTPFDAIDIERIYHEMEAESFVFSP